MRLHCVAFLENMDLMKNTEEKFRENTDVSKYNWSSYRDDFLVYKLLANNKNP
jgi:hypothetical protein